MNNSRPESVYVRDGSVRTSRLSRNGDFASFVLQSLRSSPSSGAIFLQLKPERRPSESVKMAAKASVETESIVGEADSEVESSFNWLSREARGER